MLKKVIILALGCLIVVSMLLPSCNKSKSTTTTTTTTNTVTTSTVTAHWWDSLGTPQYGGTMNLRLKADIQSFDPVESEMSLTIASAWMETLTSNDWTLDPKVFPYTTFFRPSDYVVGFVAKSWEVAAPDTFVIHLRQGVHWQNIDPANGREFTADDVAFHYGRMFGVGGGFTQPSPYWAGMQRWAQLASVTATDRYTATFKWKVPNPELMLETLQAQSTQAYLENSDAVNKWGDLSDWHHAIGTGPFILSDFQSGTSATLTRNPDYWGVDERYPQNKLPYVDTLKYLIMPDDATALAAFRGGKIDALDGISYTSSQQVLKSNPQVLLASTPQSLALSVDLRNDVKPFNDIKVRKALQLAINLPELAQNYYFGTSDPWPSSAISNYMGDWGLPYNQWPQNLKDEYAYNVPAAKQLLTDAGYSNGFDTDVVAPTTSDLALLQAVQNYFAAINVRMSIKTMDLGSWAAAVRANHTEDQMAFNTGELGGSAEPIEATTMFMSTSGSAGANYIVVRDPTYDTFYNKAVGASSVTEVKQILKDFCLYVAEQHYVVSLLVPKNFTLYQPWLKGYNGQLGVFSWWSNSPPYISLYEARFWIDKSVKTSMGY